MTFRTESRLAMGCTIDELWAYLSDVSRWAEWAPTVLSARIAGGARFEPDARIDQRAKGLFGTSRGRSQKITAADEPRSMAFAGPLGTSDGRWGMELTPIDEKHTEAMMWVEVDLKGVMRAIPHRQFQRRVQRVSDLEMVLIKAAVES